MVIRVSCGQSLESSAKCNKSVEGSTYIAFKFLEMSEMLEREICIPCYRCDLIALLAIMWIE